jgi:hypothetical protein
MQQTRKLKNENRETKKFFESLTAEVNSKMRSIIFEQGIFAILILVKLDIINTN